MTKPPDVTRRSERSRRAILDSALDLVTAVGYGKVTIEAIAARAGVGKQTIYRWWPSKGAVVFDAFLALNEGDTGLALPDSGDLDADLRALLKATFDDLVDPRFEPTYRALHAEIQHNAALATDLVERLLGPLLRSTEDRLRSAQRAGQLAPDVDLRVAVELLYGPVFHRWLLRTGPLTSEYADTVVALVLRALRP